MNKSLITSTVSALCVGLAWAFIRGWEIEGVWSVFMCLILGYIAVFFAFLFTGLLYVGVLKGEAGPGTERYWELLTIVSLTLIVASLGLLLIEWMGPPGDEHYYNGWLRPGG